MREPSRRQRGLTLMELMVVMAVVTVVFIMSYSLLQDAVQTSLFVEEHNDLPIFAQSAVNTIQRELMQTRVVFDGTAGGAGTGYYAAMQIPATLPVLAGSQLPVSNPTGTLVPDPAVTRYTGNILVIARQLEPARVTISTGVLTVDRYIFEVFYLTRKTTTNFANTGGFLDVIQATSDQYADYFQLTQWQGQTPAPTAADRTAVNTALRGWVDPRTGISQPMLRAWDPGQPAPSAFYSVNANGTFTAVAQPAIALPAYKSLVPAMNTGRISGKMNYSVGFRPTASTVFPFSSNTIAPDNVTVVLADPVPKYATFVAAQPLFPSGLEFLIVGPAGSRRILSRLVLIATYGTKFDSKEAMNITSAE